MQLGLRYVLPVMPFLVLFAAQTGRWFQWRAYPVRAAVVWTLLVLAPLGLRYHPSHLAYFNELAGGPEHGLDHLIDSNIDWGQNLGDLKNYLDEHKIEKIGLAYFGTAPPKEVGIDFDLPPARMPQPGWYAVSVNYLKGRSHALRGPDNRHFAPDFGDYQYFQAFEPTARLGYSIYVYHLEQDDVDRWVAECRRQRRQ
jgi:hypothetical protein